MDGNTKHLVFGVCVAFVLLNAFMEGRPLQPGMWKKANRKFCIPKTKRCVLKKRLNMRDKILWEILAFSIALVMVASCTMTLIGNVSASDITDQFLEEYNGYVVNPDSVIIDIVNGDNDTVLLGHRIIFNGSSYVEISGPGGTFYATGTSDLTGDGVVDTSFDTSVLGTTGLYSVSDGINTETLTVDNPQMKLDLKIGNYSTTEIPRGTPLRIDFDTNLDAEDCVKLRVLTPDGCIIKTNYNGQRFDPINMTQLLEYGSFDKSKQIGTSGWKLGTYTFSVRTKKENARGLDAASAEKTIDITHEEISIEASKTDPTINETVILTVHGVPYHNITVESSYPSETVFEGGKYDYSGPDTAGPINDVMDEDGVMHYACHFTDTGTYRINVEDLDEWIVDDIKITVTHPEKLSLKIEDDNKIRMNFDTYLIDDDRVDLKIIDSNGRLLHSNPTDYQVFYNLTVREVKGMVINTSGWNSGRHTVWIETNKSYIPVLDVHSNPVVFEIGADRIRMVPTVFFFDYEPPFQSADGGILTISEDILLYGTATENSTLDIAINDEIVKTCIPIQESGSFVDILPTYNLTPGFKDIEAFIDTHFALGEDVTGIESNGSSNVFLKSNESILSLYEGTVIIGNDLTIRGTATGGGSVDIAIEDEVVAIDILVGAGGEFVVTLPTPTTPHTDTVGVKGIKAFIDSSFTVGENVSKAASSGDSSVFLVEGVGEGEIGVFAEENETVELKIVRISVVGTAGHNITVDSSDHTHSIFPWGMLDNPFAPSLPFNHIIDEDGIRDYAVRFNETGTYTITITDIDTSNTDSVDILVEEKKVTFDMVSN